MSITQDERERLAVRDHKCPRWGCGQQAGFRCVRAGGRSFIIKRLVHPHRERIALVEGKGS